MFVVLVFVTEGHEGLGLLLLFFHGCWQQSKFIFVQITIYRQQNVAKNVGKIFTF